MQTTQLGGGLQSRRKRKRRRDFYKTHSSPNPCRVETLIPTGWRYPPTTRRQWIFCGQKSMKEKKKERERKRRRSTSGAGNERKSGNDESIVPVQRLFCAAAGLYLLQLHHLFHNHSFTSVSMCSNYAFKLQAHLRLSLAKTTMKSDRLWMLTRKLREVMHLQTKFFTKILSIFDYCRNLFAKQVHFDQFFADIYFDNILEYIFATLQFHYFTLFRIIKKISWFCKYRKITIGKGNVVCQF